MIAIMIILSVLIGFGAWALCAADKTAPQCDLCKHKEICDNDNESYFCCFERKE